MNGEERIGEGKQGVRDRGSRMEYNNVRIGERG